MNTVWVGDTAQLYSGIDLWNRPVLSLEWNSRVMDGESTSNENDDVACVNLDKHERD